MSSISLFSSQRKLYPVSKYISTLSTFQCNSGFSFFKSVEIFLEVEKEMWFLSRFSKNFEIGKPWCFLPDFSDWLCCTYRKGIILLKLLHYLVSTPTLNLNLYPKGYLMVVSTAEQLVFSYYHLFFACCITSHKILKQHMLGQPSLMPDFWGFFTFQDILRYYPSLLACDITNLCMEPQLA